MSRVGIPGQPMDGPSHPHRWAIALLVWVQKSSFQGLFLITLGHQIDLNDSKSSECLECIRKDLKQQPPNPPPQESKKNKKNPNFLLLNLSIRAEIPETLTYLAASGYAVPKSVLNATRVIKENLETKNPNRNDIA